ncbi:MAG: heme-binding domain-containing protein [Saprospiraceae bacterium]
MRKRKNWLIAIVVLLLGMQFIRIDKTNPPVDASVDYIALTNPPEDVIQMLRSACYDCHSHETQYPWYSNVAPVSWMLGNHIREGRKHLNFSTMGNLPVKVFAHKMEEAQEEVLEKKMPMKSYTFAHSDSKLTDEQRKRLAQWFADSTPDASIEEED